MIMFADRNHAGGGASASASNGDVEMRKMDRKARKDHGDEYDGYDSDGEEFELHEHGPLLAASDDGPGATGLVPGQVRQLQPRVYRQRWVQLGYLSSLALLSDWICFSTAGIPDVFEEAYPGRTSDGLIDRFLLMNVLSCLAVTDVVARFGLRRCIRTGSALMAAGTWLRSGLGIVPILFEMLGVREDVVFLDAKVWGYPLFGLPPYPVILLGTLLVGAAQPFFQCTPPLLSAQWFASNERATATAIALNFNQVGIAMAFLVGSGMADVLDGLRKYFALIALLCTAACVGTYRHFEELPPVPPSASEIEKLYKGQHQHQEPPFRVSVRSFFATAGFTRPLVAFICSIAITNVVGAFIDEVMERGGVTDRRAVAWAGAGFECAIVLGGIILGQYVDRTKEYKKVTLACIALSMIFILPLGLTEHQFGQEPVILIISLFVLGFFVGPVQPINAELAVDVTFPGDETAVESVQQFGGNFCSALLVPVAGRAAKLDYTLLPNVPFLESDIRGDVILMMLVSILTYAYYCGFDAPLRRSMADGD